MTFDLHLENFNSAHNFLTIKAFILDKCMHYDKTLPMDHVTLTVIFYLFSAHDFLNHYHKTLGFHIWRGCSLHQDLSGGNTKFDYIHIKYHIEMSPLAPHAFLGLLPIFVLSVCL